MTQEPGSRAASFKKWLNALIEGDGATVAAGLDDSIHFEAASQAANRFIPYLGEASGKAAVLAAFAKRATLVETLSTKKLTSGFSVTRGFAELRTRERALASGEAYEINSFHFFHLGPTGLVTRWQSFFDPTPEADAIRASLPDDLIAAVRAADLAATRKHLRNGVSADTRERATGLSALMFAAGLGDAALVSLLISAGANVNALDARAGASALHKACQAGAVDCVRILVENGAWIDSQAVTTGHTPLVEAIWFKSDEIVAFLLDRNARIELKTYYGFTIDQHIEYAIRVSHGQADQDKLKRIQELVAQRRARDEAGKSATVLVQAVLDNNPSALRQTLTQGAPLEQRYPILGTFQDGHTALLVAARDGRTDMVAALIESGADVNAVEPVFGAVPLHKATYNGYLDITRLLARAPGVNLNYQGASNGYTPLQDALWHGFADCAEVLLDAGASPEVVAYDGKRAYDLALEKLGPGHPLVARLKTFGPANSIRKPS